MRFPYLFASLSLVAAACGGDDSAPIDALPVDASIPDCSVTCSATDAAVDAPDVVDAPPAVDAPAAAVVVVDCAGATIASVVTATAGRFNLTQAQVTAGDIVQFTMPASHSAHSGATAGVDDGVFVVLRNETKCLQFTAPGTFPFWCDPHLFTATLTVTPAT
ncbi:MAG: hypothetical protein R3B06_15335 [Kofleriaceae bacterium]